MPLTLTWRGPAGCPIDASGLRPDAITARSADEVRRVALRAGKVSVELGELFRVEGDGTDGSLVIEGDLSAVARLGQGMSAGALTVRGPVGSHLGAGMTGGRIEVEGSVGAQAGAEMRGGFLRIRGDAGEGLGGVEPGSRLGMRDGVILVEGSAGAEVGRSLRRGCIAIAGAAGDWLGRGIVAGSIFVFGAVGAGVGAGMKRGTIALFGLPDPADPPLLPSFAPAGRARLPFLTIYLRQLARWGFPVPDSTHTRPVERYNGDLVERGQGEILVGL